MHVAMEIEQELKREDVKKWNSDYLELMEYTKNANHGRLKCFHFLLNPAWDDPIFIGINRLVSKGLTSGEQEIDPIQYPWYKTALIKITGMLS
jgi:Ca2+-dependent lipid-binding protein